jgi:hypothetical protein
MVGAVSGCCLHLPCYTFRHNKFIPNAPPVLVRVNWGEKKNCERASKPDPGAYQSSQLKPQSSLPDQVPA